MTHKKVTQQDLETVMSLQDWLNTTDRVRKADGLNDAWAIGNTDCAFRINNMTAVQRTHRDNDWNYWGDLSQVYHDNGLNYGTYLDVQTENMIVEVIGQSPPTVTVTRGQTFDNSRGSGSLSYTYTTGSSSTADHEVTVTDEVKADMEFGLEAKGFGFKVSASIGHTTATMDATHTTVSTEETINATVGSGQYAELHNVKMTSQTRYRIRVPVVMEGYVGLCTTNDQGNFNTIKDLYHFVSKDTLTRWLVLEMEAANEETQVVVYPQATALSDTEDTVNKQVLKQSKVQLQLLGGPNGPLRQAVNPLSVIRTPQVVWSPAVAFKATVEEVANVRVQKLVAVLKVLQKGIVSISTPQVVWSPAVAFKAIVGEVANGDMQKLVAVLKELQEGIASVAEYIQRNEHALE
eukprot:jgi/Chlat1/3135/Chrsp21S03370